MKAKLKFDMENNTSINHENGNDANRVLAPVFDFQKGDVVEFCDEHYFVVENNGSTGVVNPFGETFYLRNFYWKYQNEVTKFVRKPTPEELEHLGLKSFYCAQGCKEMCMSCEVERIRNKHR